MLAALALRAIRFHAIAPRFLRAIEGAICALQDLSRAGALVIGRRGQTDRDGQRRRPAIEGIVDRLPRLIARPVRVTRRGSPAPSPVAVLSRVRKANGETAP